MVLSCSVIEDAQRREQCFRAAADAAEDEDDVLRPSTLEATLEPIPEPAPERAATLPAPTEDATPAAEAPAEAPAAESPPRQRAAPPSPTENTVTREVVERTVLDIPDRFAAEVRAVHELVRNRQLLVLEGDLLFETDRAAQSRIDVGDEVRVVRASSFFGRRYRISGPARAATTATRLRCERLDLGAATRRKCALIERSDG